MTGHKNTAMHWAPKAVEESPYTACGRNIDGSCDQHEAEQVPCRFGLAWTLSTNLDFYLHEPYGLWPKSACPVCAQDASVENARRLAVR